MAKTHIAATSAARTTSGTSSPVPVTGDRVSVQVNVTAFSGTTPNLVMSLEWSADGIDWATGDPADVMTAFTTSAKRVMSFNARAALVRVVWTVTGTTPSFTFSTTIWS